MTPHPAYVVADHVPHTGEIKGWWIYDPPDGVFTFSENHPMSWRGITGIVALFLCFWPLTCVPCFMSCSYKGYQVPIYYANEITCTGR